MDTSRSENRRSALIALIEAYVPSRYKTQKQMAEALGFSPAHFAQMKSGNRAIGNDSADRIEKLAGLNTGELDAGASPSGFTNMPLIERQVDEADQKIIHLGRRESDEHQAIAEVLKLMQGMDEPGKWILVGMARQLATQHPINKQASSSQ